MDLFDSSSFAIRGAQVLGALLLAVTFLHSGLDMAIDRKGNLAFLGRYFAKTPAFQKQVPFLLTVIVALEIVGGALCLAGAVEIVVSRHHGLAVLGSLSCGASLLCLLVGQKFAKDHPG